MQSEEISKPWTTLCNRSKSCYRIWELLWNFFTGETRNNSICIKIIGLFLQVQPFPNTIWPTVFSCPTLCPHVYPWHFILIKIISTFFIPQDQVDSNTLKFWPMAFSSQTLALIVVLWVTSSIFTSERRHWRSCGRRNVGIEEKCCQRPPGNKAGCQYNHELATICPTVGP